MTYPVFSAGEVLTATDMNAVGLWLNRGCGVSSTGGTAATASNGVITVGTSNTSVTVTSAFSSTYDRYRVTIDNIVASTGGDLRMTLGSTATGYYGVYNYQIYTGSGSVFYQNNTTNAYIGGLGTIAGEQSITFDISNPNKATRTAWYGQAYGNGYLFSFGYQIADTNQYTSFTIAPGSGNLTGGTIRVYGYRN